MPLCGTITARHKRPVLFVKLPEYPDNFPENAVDTVKFDRLCRGGPRNLLTKRCKFAAMNEYTDVGDG